MIKYAEDYIDELGEHFPGIEKASLLKVVKAIAKAISVFMRKGAKSVRMGSKDPLLPSDRTRELIEITRIYGRKRLQGIYTRNRKRKARKDGETK